MKTSFVADGEHVLGCRNELLCSPCQKILCLGELLMFLLIEAKKGTLFTKNVSAKHKTFAFACFETSIKPTTTCSGDLLMVSPFNAAMLGRCVIFSALF
jgi:hypothetical protein